MCAGLAVISDSGYLTRPPNFVARLPRLEIVPRLEYDSDIYLLPVTV